MSRDDQNDAPTPLAVMQAWATAIALTERTAHELDHAVAEVQDYLDRRKQFGERRFNTSPWFGEERRGPDVRPDGP